MSALSRRLSALLLGLVVAGAGASAVLPYLPRNSMTMKARQWASFQHRAPPKFPSREEAFPEVQEQWKQVEAAIEALGEHPWAGEYYCGDGLGSNSYLLISLDRFAFFADSDIGVGDGKYGSLAESGSLLRLAAAQAGKEEWRLAPELVPIAWGDRRYLVPPEQLIAFFHLARLGSEPRDHTEGDFFLRGGDHKKKVSGLPELPDEYAYVRQSAAIEPRIVRILDRRSVKEGPSLELLETDVLIDAGRSHGVFEGMSLKVADPSSFYWSALVVAVNEQSATAVFKLDKDDPEPQAGWLLRLTSSND